MTKRFFLFPVFLLIAIGIADAQPVSMDNGVPVDPAVHKLDGVASRMTAYLKAVPTFQVETTTQWTLDGGKAQSGGARSRFSAQHPNAFRLEIGSRTDGKVSFLCASDGKTLTRFYHDGRLSIFSRRDGGLDQLLDDAMTDSSLKGSGLDVILRSDAHHYIMASVSDVKDCDVEEVQGRRAHHFSANWFGGSRVDFWIAADHEPVLLRWKRTQTLELAGKPHEMEIDSQLVWKMDPPFSTDQTVIELASDAIEVKDLQGYLLTGGTDKLLGTPAPLTPLKLLDGSQWDLAKHQGEDLVVLFFFASWATPSTHDMPAILTSIKEFEQHGVVFYAVAVGESPQTVREFVESRNYSHPVVLDPEQKATAAYRITSLPVTVLIGKDGILQSVHVGILPEDRVLIREDLKQLVAGKKLIEANKQDN